MKTKLQPRRVIAMLLTLAMLLGVMPISAMAAGFKGEKPDEVYFKTMRMSGILSPREIAKYLYAERNNHFSDTVNLGYEDSWVKLSYVIEKSQYVSLVL